MKPIIDLTAKDMKTGEVKTISIDPRVYMSVSDWKPVTPESFAILMHSYQTQDANRDEFGNGLMSSKVLRLDRETMAVIHYSVKDEGSPVSSPVLMTLFSVGGKNPVCFSSLRHGFGATG